MRPHPQKFMCALVFDNTGGYGIRPYDRNMTRRHSYFFVPKNQKGTPNSEVPFLFL